MSCTTISGTDGQPQGRAALGARPAHRAGSASPDGSGGAGPGLVVCSGRPDGSGPSRPGERPAAQDGAHRDEPASGPADPEDAARPGGAPGLRVLVVEDDEPVREHALRLVRSLGYRVRAASSGAEALRLLARDPLCDILFTDVVMPGMSGGELALAARLLTPGLAVVFMTGHHADPLVEEMRRGGTAVVLTKPYRRQAAAAALLQAMDCRIKA